MAEATGFSTQCTQQSVGIGNTMVSTLLQTLLAAQCAISPPEFWPTDYGPTSLQYGLGTYDFVVIGAGTAGSVVASRLSENANWKVLVLEAGGDPPQESEIPALFFTLQHTKYNWNYYTEPDGKSCLAYNNQACYWPRGKMIGGTGSINAMFYVRGNRQDYDNWEQKGNPQWGWRDVLPYFEKSLQVANNESDFKGRVTINPFNVEYPEIRDMLFEGAEELGIPKIDTVKEGADIGYTAIPGTVKNGRRMSTGKGYLARAKDRPNLHVIKNAMVTNLNFDAEGKEVTGISFIYNGKYQMRVNIAKEVILSAGALDSPKVLMLSGIGPENHLNKLGIPLRKSLSVGDNLQDHLIVPLIFKINESQVKRDTMKGQLDATYNYLLNQTGPLSSVGTAAIMGFINSDRTSSSPYPDIIYHHLFMQSGTANLDTWIRAVGLSDSIAQSLRAVNENDHILLVYMVLLRPKSIGTLRLRSSDPWQSAKIVSNYLEQPEDIETLLRGIEFQMNIEQTAAFRKQNAKIAQIDLPECDQFPFKGKEYWKCYMKYMTNTIYHMAGTVKMGPDTDPNAVLDSRLRVKGIKRLRVADTSIMPDVVSANTNAPTIMIAEKAVDFIRQQWSCSEL